METKLLKTKSLIEHMGIGKFQQRIVAMVNENELKLEDHNQGKSVF